MTWVAEALRQSHHDERRYHADSIARLQAEQTRLQVRLDAMYIDKLDGRIDAAFFDRKAAEWRAEQRRILEAVQAHQTANAAYFDEGVRLLDLARRAHTLFRRQEAREKRRLIDFVVSNCTWRDGELRPTYRQPFDLLAIAVANDREQCPAGTAPTARFEKWLPE